MNALSEAEMGHLVEMIRRNADVPRVRSSEIRKVVETLQTLVEHGLVTFKLPETV